MVVDCAVWISDCPQLALLKFLVLSDFILSEIN